MNTFYTLNKINGPILLSNILHRETLVTKLSEVVTGNSSTDRKVYPPCKLVLICAPAGYGKTTLLADFAQSNTIPCCWYFLDPSDAEPVTFLRLLVASIRQRFPQFGTSFDASLSSAFTADANRHGVTYTFDVLIEMITQMIANEIDEHFALLLCNYHEINEHMTINVMMDHLLSQLPAHCTIILESRGIPGFSTASLLSRQEAIGISSTALRFSAQELQQLFKHRGLPALDNIMAEQLTQLFDGWIMGLLLGTHLGNLQLLHTDATDLPMLSDSIQVARENSAIKLTLREDQLHLFYTLIDQIFQREAESYHFLKEAAILDAMTPELCNALLDIENAGEYLYALEQQGLFVRKSGTLLQRTYTCHPFLREIFCKDLACREPERFRMLHKRASRLFQEVQDPGRAIWHALEAQQPELAVDLILAVQRDLLAQGRGTSLAQWIDLLPASTRREHLWLQVLRAKIHLLFGELEQALPLLETASELLITLEQLAVGPDKDILRAEIALTQSRAQFQMGKYDQAQALCQQVIERLPINVVELHAEAYQLLGVCANVRGNVSEGIAHLQKALQLWGRDKVLRQTAELHSTLASSYSLLGNFALADHHSSRAVVCWEHLQDDWGRAYNLVRMGLIKQRQGENLHEAEALFKEAIELTRGPIHFQRGEAYALASLGELYLEQRRYKEALPYAESGLVLARCVKDRYLFHTTLCILAMIYLFLDDAQTALLLLSEVEASGDDHANYEQIIYKLTMGAIWLRQCEYQRAYSYLNWARAATRERGLMREQIQARIYLAACQLGLGRRAEMKQSLDDLIPLLARGSYERLCLIELQRFPNLEQIVLNAQEYALLRIHLHLEEQIFPAEQQMQVMVKHGETRACEIIPTKQDVRLKMLALGEPLVLRDGSAITRWRMARAMELCFFLLESDRPLHKEQIITALWEEMDEHVDQTFRSTIYYVKKTLGEGVVQVQSGTYALDTSLIWSDIAAFRQHQTRYRIALAQNTPFAAREELLNMVELYRGDYLQPFYSTWCHLRRDELSQAYLEARRELAKICWQLEWVEECITHWQHMLMIDNFLEDAHYGLMRCYLKQGKRSLALRQYQRCATILHDELGIIPGPMMQKLYQRLVSETGV